MSNIPFLCHYVDGISNNPNKDLSFDFKHILENKLHLSLDKNDNSNKRVLILSRKIDFEADIVSIELLRRGIDYIRLNVEDIPYSFSIAYNVNIESDVDCQINLQSTITNISNIATVWLRNFEYEIVNSSINDLHTVFIDQQWNDALQILFDKIKGRWINSLESTYNANNRVNQFTIANKVGFKVPATLITNDPDRATSFYYKYNKDIIIKALHHHSIEFQNKVFSYYTHKVTNEDLIKFEDLKYAPCIMQERLTKRSELRVTVIRDEVFAVKIEIPSNSLELDDIHRYNISQLPKVPIQLDHEMNTRCINLVKLLGLDYGAIDFVIDKDNKLYFLEVNSTGDWLWIERQTKLPITKTVVDLIANTIDNSK